MKLHPIFVGLSVLFIIWLPIVGLAFPSEAPEAPFAADQTSDQLVIVCGIPEEFDPANPVSAPASQKPTAAFSVPSTTTRLETASTQVPEPSTMILVLVGVGLIGLVRRTRT